MILNISVISAMMAIDLMMRTITTSKNPQVTGTDITLIIAAWLDGKWTTYNDSPHMPK